MKHIYTEHLGLHSLVQVSDETIEMIDEARGKIFDLVMEKTWKPTFRIDLPEYAHDDNSFVDSGFVLNIAWDDGKTDNAAEGVFRTISERTPRGFVKTDLGHYCFEGWSSDVDFRDVSELPDVWFSKKFMNYFIDKDEINYVHNLPWDVLLEEHHRALIPRLYREAGLMIKYAGEEEKVFLRQVMSESKNSWNENKDLSGLFDLFEKPQRKLNPRKETF